MKNFAKKNWVKLAAIYGSVFLGAGFASGQELLQYFVEFGRAGIAGLILAGVIFASVGWAVLRICRRHKLTSYHSLMHKLFGAKLGSIMEGAVVAFLFCLFVAMLAGAGATGREAFGIPFTLGAAIVGLAVLFVLRFGIGGIVKLNLVLAPFMLFGGIGIGLYSYFSYTSPAFAISHGGLGIAWIVSAVVYACYNLVTGIPILAAVSPMAKTKQDTMLGGLVGGGIITLLGICMALPLFLHYANIASLEIPLLYIATYQGNLFRYIYLAVLIAAIFTTAACNAFAVLQWLNPRSRKFIAACTICGIGIIVSHIGFANIVAYVYPAFGILGIIKIAVILVKAV